MARTDESGRRGRERGVSTDRERMQALQLVARNQVTQIAAIIGECADLRARNLEIKAENNHLQDLLRQVEWIDIMPGHGWPAICLFCCHSSEHGHRPDCPLGLALAEGGKP